MTDPERDSHVVVTAAPEREAEAAGGTTPSAAADAARSPDIQRPGQLIRIASMVRELLGEVRQSSPDDAGRKRLREVYERAVAELRDTLSGPLQQELDTLTIPLEGTPSEISDPLTLWGVDIYISAGSRTCGVAKLVNGNNAIVRI